jgi:hypothetical protein
MDGRDIELINGYDKSLLLQGGCWHSNRIPRSWSQKCRTPLTCQPFHPAIESQHRLFLGCFGCREVVSLQGEGNEVCRLVEEVYSGACCAVLDSPLFVLAFLPHQDELASLDGGRGLVIFSWPFGQSFGFEIADICVSIFVPKPAPR